VATIRCNGHRQSSRFALSSSETGQSLFPGGNDGNDLVDRCIVEHALHEFRCAEEHQRRALQTQRASRRNQKAYSHRCDKADTRHVDDRVARPGNDGRREWQVDTIDAGRLYVEGELDVIDSSIWFAKVARGEYSIGLNLTGVGIDDPDVNFYENYACGSERNYTKYCNPEVDKLIEQQSRETDTGLRRRLVWQVEKKLAEDGARPIILQYVTGLCWQPYVKNFVLHKNGIYNNWRFDEVWLDR